MKKFTLITSWFLYLRSYKRITSFRQWISKLYLKTTSKNNYKNIKILKNLIFKTNLNRILWYGLNFFISKNFGLMETGGYIKIYYPSAAPISKGCTGFYFLDKYRFLQNRLTLSTIFFNWSFGIAKAINLNTILKTKKSLFPFVAKNFFKKQFLTNKFFNILWSNRFHKRRKFWFKKFNLKFFKTGFSKKYFKYFFCQRYLNWMSIESLELNFSYTNSIKFSLFYLKSIASQFVAKFNTLNLITNNRIISKKNLKIKKFEIIKKKGKNLKRFNDFKFSLRKFYKQLLNFRNKYLKFNQCLQRYDSKIMKIKHFNKCQYFYKLNNQYCIKNYKILKKFSNVIFFNIENYLEKKIRWKNKYKVFDQKLYNCLIVSNKKLLWKNKQFIKNFFKLEKFLINNKMSLENLLEKKLWNNKMKFYYKSNILLHKKFAKSSFLKLDKFRLKRKNFNFFKNIAYKKKCILSKFNKFRVKLFFYILRVSLLKYKNWKQSIRLMKIIFNKNLKKYKNVLLKWRISLLLIKRYLWNQFLNIFKNWFHKQYLLSNKYSNCVFKISYIAHIVRSGFINFSFKKYIKKFNLYNFQLKNNVLSKVFKVFNWNFFKSYKFINIPIISNYWVIFIYIAFLKTISLKFKLNRKVKKKLYLFNV